jgi:hypothetical protein
VNSNDNTFDYETHIFRSSSNRKAPPVVSVDRKMKLSRFTSGDYIFYPLPADEEWVRREGWDMSHCLAICQGDYCLRMRRGEIEVWSMTHISTNTPVVNIEVAITRSSYGGQVSRPTVSQIRGVANQCPPEDNLLPHIVSFLNSEVGSAWHVGNHGVKNFDNQLDGDLVMRRWKELEGTSAHTGAQD